VNVEVRLFATLARDANVAAGSPVPVNLPDRSTLTELLGLLHIAEDRIHLVIIDGRVMHERFFPLVDGCRIGLFPPVGGG